MATVETAGGPRRRISLEEIDEFIRSSRSEITAEKVATILDERDLISQDYQKRRELLDPLVEDLRRRLLERGISPSTWQRQRSLRKKEREMIRCLTILQIHIADGLVAAGYLADGSRHAEEGRRAAAEIGDDHLLGLALEIEATALRIGGDLNAAYAKQQESHQVAVKQNDPELIRRSLFNQGVTLQRMGNHEESIRLFYQVIAGVESAGDDSTVVSALAYKNIAVGLTAIGDQRGASEAIARSLEHADPTMPGIIAELCIVRTQIAQTCEDYATAFEAATEGLGHAADANDPLRTARLHALLGSVQSDIGDRRDALASFDHALEILADRGDPFEGARIQIRRAALLEELGEQKRGDEIFRDLLEEEHPWHDDADRYSWVLTQAADLHARNGRYDRAERIYRQALDICRGASIRRGVNGLLLRLGRIHRMREDYRQGIETYLQLLEQPEVDAESATVVKACRELAELYELTGTPADALPFLRRCLDESIRMKESLHNENLDRLRVEHQVSRFREEAQRQRDQRRRGEAGLSEALVALAGKSALLEELRTELEELVDDRAIDRIPTVHRALHRMIRRLREADGDPERETSESSLVPEDFLTTLRDRHPDLTTGQTRLAGLIRIGMERDDICRVLDIIPETLKKQRYRLRARLRLETEESLEGYLAGI